MNDNISLDWKRKYIGDNTSLMYHFTCLEENIHLITLLLCRRKCTYDSTSHVWKRIYI